MDEVKETVTPPVITPEQDKFTGLVRRVIRRKKIGQALKKTASFTEASQEVRRFERENNVGTAVENLITAETFTEPKRVRLAEELSHRLREKFPHVSNLAVVLLGSSLHGGAVIRKIAGAENDFNPDIDWAVVFDKGKEPIPFSEINNFGRTLIPQIAANVGLPETIHSDPAFFHIENLSSLSQALRLIKKAKDFTDYEDLLIYLIPSYPPEINRQNRRYFLSGLSKLGQKDPVLWQTKVKRLLDTWKISHQIQEKHFGNLPRGEKFRDSILAWEVELTAGEAMAERMNRLLCSTGPKKSSDPNQSL